MREILRYDIFPKQKRAEKLMKDWALEHVTLREFLHLLYKAQRMDIVHEIEKNYDIPWERIGSK
jgi:hypothetical protein